MKKKLKDSNLTIVLPKVFCGLLGGIGYLLILLFSRNFYLSVIFGIIIIIAVNIIQVIFSKINANKTDISLYSSIISEDEIKKFVNKGINNTDKIKNYADLLQETPTKKSILKIVEYSNSMFHELRKDASKYAYIDKLNNFYFPTILRILKTYTDIKANKISTRDSLSFNENAEAFIAELEVAFKKMLATIYDEDIFDATVEMASLKSEMASRGLLNNDFNIK